MLTPTIQNASANQAAQPRTTDLGSKDIFLKLLVAQMKFQDPLKPQDPTKMSSQLAQFNMVEQQTNTNALLEKLVANGGSGTAASNSGGAAAYLGRTATIAQNELSFAGTPASFTIGLAANASNVTVQILDASGQPIRTMQLGAMSAGNSTMAWDGKDDSGAVVPQGVYQTSIQAVDSQGQPMDVSMLQSGRINAVQFTSNGPLYVVGGLAVPQSAIQEIKL